MKRKEKFKKILLFAFLFLLPLISINSNASEINTGDIKKELVTEVKKYIKTKYQNCPDEIPENIVKFGLQYNIDICFMMAQTEIETCFGKAGIGRAASRHSLFGVENKVYNSYPEAIGKYILLLKKSYLVKGRTEQDLMRRYVTGSGYRYAGNHKYEIVLRNTYNRICKQTNIKQLQLKIIK